MLGKVGVPIAVFLSLLFVAVGDRVLPEPLGAASTQSRTVVVATLSSLLNQTLKILPEDTRRNVRNDAIQDATCESNHGSC